jgi:hypothetical protein
MIADMYRFQRFRTSIITLEPRCHRLELLLPSAIVSIVSLYYLPASPACHSPDASRKHSAPSHTILQLAAVVVDRNGRDCRTSSGTGRLCILSGQEGTPQIAARALLRVLTDNSL